MTVAPKKDDDVRLLAINRIQEPTQQSMQIMKKLNQRSWFFGGYKKEEQNLLQNSFSKLRPYLEEIGVTAFKRLHDENKEAFDLFTAKEILPPQRDSIETSERARSHCYRVMLAIERCISTLDNEQSVIDYLTALANRHCGFGIKAEFFLVSKF